MRAFQKLLAGIATPDIFLVGDGFQVVWVGTLSVSTNMV
jgi:hypothetical protein